MAIEERNQIEKDFSTLSDYYEKDGFTDITYDEFVKYTFLISKCIKPSVCAKSRLTTTKDAGTHGRPIQLKELSPIQVVI